MITSIDETTIDKLLAQCTFTDHRVSNAVVVSCTLPNGFVITEQGATISESNFNYEIGKSIALRNIKDTLWSFEGYRACWDNWREQNE